MDLVINEWFPEYCKVEASNEDKELLQAFLEKFIVNNDVLYIKRPSAFLQKIYSYSKEYQAHRNTYTMKLLTFFIRNVIENSSRCVFVDEECILEEIILNKLGVGNYSSNTYLFEAAAKTESKIIVTTDDKLRGQMHNVGGYQVISLKDFLQQY